MLYFEDFMEAIENLPSELNESLTNVRQLDLQAQNILDLLSESVQGFFEDCKVGKLLDYEKSSQISNITKDFEKALIHCKDKREIVENIYSTYLKLVRKLDIELEKFRLELEADNSGVTEQIEKRVHNVLGKAVNTVVKSERRRQRLRFQQSGPCKSNFSVRKRLVDQAFRTAFKSASMRPTHPSTKHLNTNRSVSNVNSEIIANVNNSSLSPSSGFRVRDSIFHRGFSIHSDVHPCESRDESMKLLTHQTVDGIGDVNNEQISLNVPGSSLKIDEDTSSQHSNTTYNPTQSSNTPYLLQDTPSDSLIISASKGSNASSTSIASTTGSGRMIKTGNILYNTSETDIPNNEKLNLTSRSNSLEMRNLDSPSIPTWSNISNNRERRRYSRRSDRANANDELSNDESSKLDDTVSSLGGNTSPAHSFTDHVYDFGNSTKLENPDDPQDDDDEEDEDFKRYCICREVSYGDMIACDAPDCPFEWFHYACVNLSVAPKGRWFCPSCSKSLVNKRTIKKSSSRKH